ncbi:MAG TPA: anti-sigma factor antagonist [bacterium]|nr:anti-sigma factor antagonist [bacterium]
MQVKIRMAKDVVVVGIKGNLMGGKETDACHQKVKDLLQEGKKKIVADLSNVKWINSKGLGMLMACLTSVRNAKGVFKISGSSDKVKSMLMITKLITIFQTYNSVDEAVDSF